ncbi:MAG: hypothetical protein IPI69_16320 [Bacteroidales bacterium]|nr:hypothetical protein [Bacteroidales bacterium]
MISFKQKPHVDMPLFMGHLYIATDSYAALPRPNSASTSRMGLQLRRYSSRRSARNGSDARKYVSYRTKYREQDGKWYFAYSRAEVKNKVNWKRKLFNTFYTTMPEMAITGPH